MSDVESLRAELADLNEVLSALGEGQPEEYSAEWMGWQSLLTRQAELFHQLEITEATFPLSVSLHGGAVLGNTVRAGFLGEFLKEFQDTLAAAIQTVMHGVETTRGRLPMDVLEAAHLRIVATAPGSFVVGLEGPPRTVQEALDIDGLEDEPPPPFDEAFERLMDVLSAVETDVSGERLAVAIGDLGGARSLRHLVELAKSIATTGTGATFARRDPFDDRVREARLSALGASRLRQVLSRTEQDLDYVELTGVLSGVRWKTGLFDLEVVTDGDREVYSGRVVRDLRDSIRSAFDRRVRVVLERTVTRTPVEGQESTTYRLIHVEPAPDAEPTP